MATSSAAAGRPTAATQAESGLVPRRVEVHPADATVVIGLEELGDRLVQLDGRGRTAPRQPPSLDVSRARRLDGNGWRRQRRRSRARAVLPHRRSQARHRRARSRSHRAALPLPTSFTSSSPHSRRIRSTWCAYCSRLIVLISRRGATPASSSPATFTKIGARPQPRESGVPRRGAGRGS
jgi:hypothetical protein